MRRFFVPISLLSDDKLDTIHKMYTYFFYSLKRAHIEKIYRRYELFREKLENGTKGIIFKTTRKQSIF